MIGTEQNKTASDALKSVSCVKSCSGQGVCNDGKCKKKNARRVPGGECHLASHLPGSALRTFVES